MSVQARPEVVRQRREPLSVADEQGPIGRVLDALRPDEGWASLPLVLILCGAMAWSIANARWINGRDELTSFLIWIALAAVLWSYLSARLGMSPWLAHALGCFIGAVVIIEAIGMIIPTADPSPGGWFHATANSVTQAYLDLTWRHQISTLQYGHFCLILGIVVWGTAQAAAYDVFGYHRSVNGVLLLAVVLIANMALTDDPTIRISSWPWSSSARRPSFCCYWRTRPMSVRAGCGIGSGGAAISRRPTFRADSRSLRRQLPGP